MSERLLLKHHLRKIEQSESLIKSYKKLRDYCYQLKVIATTEADQNEIRILIGKIDFVIDHIMLKKGEHRPEDLRRTNLLPLINCLRKKFDMTKISLEDLK
ncbi:hypothetical protein A2906_01390 [Candidatus Nomurabacteria bacterium RIFCSPLOWO2_01_FULL_37_25]|nr:MAG: hypothetical protein A2640_01915 [Candidatus Nomurabacteria bacterium RIFCSPHIGHO2_01_FULL_36_23]OGI88195.1 MAG: hypothetical protein A2906_01390 [Candidatus Nomurabacteria bacterium RIFCSPLOWO2_01_FULL_37_25]